MKVITVDKNAMKTVLKSLGYNLDEVNVDEVGAITQVGLVKKDLISLIELSDSIRETNAHKK